MFIKDKTKVRPTSLSQLLIFALFSFISLHVSVN